MTQSESFSIQDLCWNESVKERHFIGMAPSPSMCAQSSEGENSLFMQWKVYVQMLKMVHSIQHESEAGRSVNLTTSASTLGINLSLCLIFGRRFFDMVVPEEAKSFLVSFKEVWSSPFIIKLPWERCLDRLCRFEYLMFKLIASTWSWWFWIIKWWW